MPRDKESSTPRGFGLNTHLELQQEFKDSISEALTAIALSAVAPAMSDSHPVIKTLLPLLPRLKNIVANGKTSFTAKNYSNLCRSAGVVFVSFASQSGQTSWLEEAIVSLNLALQNCPNRETSDEWARIQNSLGYTFNEIGSLGKKDAEEKLQDSLAA